MKNEILPYLRDDAIGRAIKNDRLILMFGNKLTQKYGEKYLNYYVRSNLRALGKLLLCSQKVDESIEGLADLFKPLHFDTLLAGVQLAAEFDEKTNMFKSPTLAANLGTLVKKCGNLLLTYCITHNNKEGRKEVKDFMHILCDEYGAAVSRKVIEARTREQRNKHLELPSHNDVVRLSNYLKAVRINCVKKLKEQFSNNVWSNLCRAVLVSVQVFNRRRPGEVERLLISDYRKNSTVSPSSTALHVHYTG